MVQDLTDVLCTAGKLNAVLPLVPFQCSSAISPSNFPPPHFPLSLFSSHCCSFSFSLFISMYIPSHILIPHPFLPLFFYHCLAPFTALSVFPLPRPLPQFSPCSLILIFPKKTSPSHDSILKAVTFSSIAID